MRSAIASSEINENVRQKRWELGMTASSGTNPRREIARRVLFKTAGAGVLLAAGAVGLDGTLNSASAGVAPNPLTPKILPGPYTVELRDFASPPPTSAHGARARLNFLYHRGDGSGKLFVNDSRGKLWSLDAATGDATLFLDFATLRAGALYVDFYQQGLRSFAFHPSFAIPGAPGHCCFYTVSAETAESKPANVRLFAGDFPVVHHNVVAEWKVDAATLSTVVPTSRREFVSHCAVAPRS